MKIGLARVWLHQGKAAQAEQASQLVLQHSPDNLDALLVAGLACSAEGQLQKAKEYLARGVQLSGTDSDFHEALAAIAEQENDPRKRFANTMPLSNSSLRTGASRPNETLCAKRSGDVVENWFRIRAALPGLLCDPDGQLLSAGVHTFYLLSDPPWRAPALAYCALQTCSRIFIGRHSFRAVVTLPTLRNDRTRSLSVLFIVVFGLLGLRLSAHPLLASAGGREGEHFVVCPLPAAAALDGDSRLAGRGA